MPEYFLRHLVVGADIKHVNGPVRIKGKIAQGRNQAAGQVDCRRACKVPNGYFPHIHVSGRDSKED